MNPVLSVSDLNFTYPEYSSVKNRTLYNNLTFVAGKGEIVLFLAPPESGKTTLSRIITSLIPRYTGGILDGKITVCGTDVQSEKPYNLNEKIGIVFQDPEEQILTPLVENEIGFTLETAGIDYDEIEKRVESAVDFMEIDNLKGKNPALLSGGEKRKVLISCLAASDPELWVLDETLEEIDPVARKKILEKLKKSGKTILILTSKMLDIYRNYCSRFYLFNGRDLVSEEGAPGKIFMEKAESAGVFLNHEKIVYPSGGEGSVSDRKEVLIRAENIRYRYPESTFSLSVDDFELRKGEVVALLGHNGSGKSTFAKILSGLIKPESGAIYLSCGNGVNEVIHKADKDDAAGKKDVELLKYADLLALNRNTAYLFQNPDYQLFLPTVKDELSYGLKGEKAAKSVISEKIRRASGMFRLEDPETPPSMMSYGARKRLQAAIYYLLEKKIILIDEADSGLSFDDYVSILDKLDSSSSPHAILVITHDVKLSAKIADRIVMMKNGEIITEDPEKEFEKLVNTTF